jgi:hypothetical protein
MKTLLLLTILPALSACGLTPKQMEKLDGAMCTKTAGYGVTNTTTIVAGASKGSGLAVNGETCSISAAGK